MSDTNYTRIGYVEETTFGTTPSANLQLMRRTGGQLSPTRQTTRSAEIRSDLRPGEPVRTAEGVGGTINVEWSYGTLDDLLEGMLMNTWDSTVLVDGTTEKSYTFEEQFVDPSISPSQYLIYKGCRISQLTLSLALGSIVTGGFSVLGATPSIAQASAGTGNTAATTTGVFNTVDMVTTLEENSSAISRVTGVEITMSRSLRAKGEIGALNPFDIGVGRLMVEGSITQYFEDDVLMDAWFAFGDRSLDIVMDDSGGGGNTVQCEIPKMKLVGDPVVEVSGPDADCMVTTNFEAYAAVADAALIRFTNS